MNQDQQSKNTEYKELVDCEGVEFESGVPFRFACCDCGLVHDVVIVSHDDNPVGFAVKRNEQATVDRRKEIPSGGAQNNQRASLELPEVQALRKYKDRLRFVADDNCSFNTWVQDDYSVKYRLGWYGDTEWQDQWYDSPEEAIDAAMEKQK